MSSYMQMGHDTENLIGEDDLELFNGIILSPVNRPSQSLRSYVDGFRERGKYNIVFDSQFYYPRSEKGCLNSYPYFPDEYKTADFSSEQWQEKILDSLLAYAIDINADILASPVVIPKVWDLNYYNNFTNLCDSLIDRARNRMKIFETILVNLDNLSSVDYVLSIASLTSKINPGGFLLVVESDVNARREINASDSLFGLMILIHELASTNIEVLVSHSSSDMLLYKYAGASSCSTGKYFNLRRFSKSRFDETGEGRGLKPYWFEHGLLAFIEEADVRRLKRRGFEELIGKCHSTNNWASKIISQFEDDPVKPWVALGWRQYLSWFCKTEDSLSGNLTEARKEIRNWLIDAENAWIELERKDILLDDPKNDGSWIRKWRQAISDFDEYLSISQ